MQEYKMSLILNWNQYSLGLEENDNHCKPESLYVEAVK